MRAGDRLSAERRALPWVKVEKDYVFDAPEGRVSLADLFDGCSQLIVHHLMFHPDWEAGCPGCSFQADHIDGPGQHLEHHDVRIVAVSRAPLAKLVAYKRRMGWRFDWMSSYGSDFNYDFRVSFAEDDVAKAASTTISGRPRSTLAIKARSCPASACSARIRTGRSSIPTPPTPGASTPYSGAITTSTSRRRGGARATTPTGPGVTTNTRGRARGKAAWRDLPESPRSRKSIHVDYLERWLHVPRDSLRDQSRADVRRPLPVPRLPA
jgi:predicted dithiol-disulfide oxidoreductase (DUF899 family)